MLDTVHNAQFVINYFVRSLLLKTECQFRHKFVYTIGRVKICKCNSNLTVILDSFISLARSARSKSSFLWWFYSFGKCKMLPWSVCWIICGLPNHVPKRSHMLDVGPSMDPGYEHFWWSNLYGENASRIKKISVLFPLKILKICEFKYSNCRRESLFLDVALKYRNYMYIV